MNLGYGLTLPPGGGATATGALAELNGYSDGFAFIAANGNGVGEVAVKDTGTPANNLRNVAASELITQSGTSPKLVLQPDGAYAWTKHNFARNTEDFTTGWTAQDGTAIEGTTEVRELADTGLHYVQHNISDVIAGYTYRQAVELKKGDGASAPDIVQLVFRSDRFGANTWQNVDLSDGTLGTSGSANIDQGIEDIGDGWYRVYVVALCTGGGSNSQYVAFTNDDDGLGRVPSYAGDAAANVFARKWQFHYGADEMDYMAAGASAVVGLPFEWDASPDTGSARWRMLVEPAATGLALHNRDLTDAVWTKTNTTALKNVTGVDGMANGASRLTASANNGTCLQAITSTSAARVFSPFVKRITGTGTVEVTLDNGSTWTAITDDLSTDEWFRIEATQTLADPTVGFRLGTSGDVIAVDIAGMEDGTSRTSPIPTYGATVTRGRDWLHFATSLIPYDNSEGALFAQVRGPAINQFGVIVYLNTISFAESFGIAQSNGNNTGPGDNFISSMNDGASARLQMAQTADDGATHRLAATFDAANLAGVADDGSVVTDTAQLPAPTVFNIGARDNGFNYLGYIDRVVYIPQRVSDATLQAWTA